MQCQICNELTKSRKALAIHINNKHPETTKEEYFIKYISADNEHLCKNCGNINTFKGFAKGFGTYCSTKCMSNSSDIRNKKKSTLIDKYGVTNISQLESVKQKKKDINIEKYGVEHAFQSTEIKNKSKETLIERYGVDNAMKVDSIKDKLKNTMVERYGVENPRQSKEISNKAKQTNLKKYGKEYYSQTDEYKGKVKETCLENFGVEHHMHSEEVKNKIKATNIKIYGVENPLSSPQVQDKVKQTNIERYGTPFATSSEIVKNTLKQNNFKKYGVKNTFQIPKSKQIIRYKNLKNAYDRLFNTNRLNSKVTPLFEIDDYKGVQLQNKYEFKCNECDNKFIDNLDNGRIPRCLKCNPYLSGSSKGEHEVYEFVKSILPENELIIQNDRSAISPKELDIYIPGHKLAIEYNGLYWHSEKQGKDQYYHQNKYKSCKDNGIQLIQIFDDEWFNKEDIIKSIIKNKLKLTDNKIYARKCTIKKLKNNEVRDFLDENHLQGFILGSHYALEYKNQIVSVLTMNKSRYDLKEDYEILRFCTKLNTNVVGGFQKLIKDFSKGIQGSIITYADLRYGSGSVYETSGFEYSHTSLPNYFYTNDYTNRLSRLKFQKHKLQSLLEDFDPTLTEWQNMQLNSYDRIWDCGNNVFKKKVV